MDTERWLRKQAHKGLLLQDTDFCGKFVFADGGAVNRVYCFTYSKFEENNRAQDDPYLKKHGWIKIKEHDRWSLYTHDEGVKPEVTPNRRGLYLRNNSLLSLYSLLSSIFILTVFGITFGEYTYSGHISDQAFFLYALVIIALCAALLTVNFIFFLHLTADNNKILDGPASEISPEYAAYKKFLTHRTFEGWLEKLLLKDGDIIKKIHPIWFYSPRGFEHWLFKMEQSGYNLYKVNKNGMLFYFTKNASRKIKYCILNDSLGGCENTQRCLGDGWSIVYSNGGFFSRVTMLAKVYETVEPKPFVNREQYIANARDIAIKYSLAMLLILFMLLGILVLMAFLMAGSMLLYAAGLAAVICAVLIFRMFAYYIYTVVIAKTIYS